MNEENEYECFMDCSALPNPSNASIRGYIPLAEAVEVSQISLQSYSTVLQCENVSPHSVGEAWFTPQQQIISRNVGNFSGHGPMILASTLSKEIKGIHNHSDIEVWDIEQTRACNIIAEDRTLPLLTLRQTDEGVVKSMRTSTYMSDTLIITGGKDKKIDIWKTTIQRTRDNLRNCRFNKICSLPGHSDWVDCVTLGRTNQWAFSGSRDGSVRFWSKQSDFFGSAYKVATASKSSTDTLGGGNWRSAGCVKSAHGGSDFVHCCDRGLDNKAVSGGSDWSVRLWDVCTMQEKARFISFFGHTYSVNTVACDGNNEHMVASGGEDKKVIIWDTRTNDPVRVIEEHEGTVQCVKFDPSKGTTEWVISGGDDGFLHVHDIRTWKISATLQNPPIMNESGQMDVNYFDFTPKSIYSGPFGTDSRSWEAENRGKTMFYAVNNCDVCLDFDGDNNVCYLITDFGNRLIRVWKYVVGQWLLLDNSHQSHENWLNAGYLRLSTSNISSICLIPFFSEK